MRRVRRRAGRAGRADGVDAGSVRGAVRRRGIGRQRRERLRAERQRCGKRNHPFMQLFHISIPPEMKRRPADGHCTVFNDTLFPLHHNMFFHAGEPLFRNKGILPRKHLLFLELLPGFSRPAYIKGVCFFPFSSIPPSKERDFIPPPGFVPPETRPKKQRPCRKAGPLFRRRYSVRLFRFFQNGKAAARRSRSAAFPRALTLRRRLRAPPANAAPFRQTRRPPFSAFCAERRRSGSGRRSPRWGRQTRPA